MLTCCMVVSSFLCFLRNEKTESCVGKLSSRRISTPEEETSSDHLDYVLCCGTTASDWTGQGQTLKASDVTSAVCENFVHLVRLDLFEKKREKKSHWMYEFVGIFLFVCSTQSVSGRYNYNTGLCVLGEAIDSIEPLLRL